jgi:hypothetical protein
LRGRDNPRIGPEFLLRSHVNKMRRRGQANDSG